MIAALCLLVAAAGAGPVGIPVPALVEVPAGPFVAGSDAAEREAAYRLDEAAYGHDRTRKRGWYDRERPRRARRLGRFFVTRTPITNREYAAFVADTGHRAPDVDAATWRGYRLVHPFDDPGPQSPFSPSCATLSAWKPCSPHTPRIVDALITKCALDMPFLAQTATDADPVLLD